MFGGGARPPASKLKVTLSPLCVPEMTFTTLGAQPGQQNATQKKKRTTQNEKKWNIAQETLQPVPT
jgi:hypothetical protein